MRGGNRSSSRDGIETGEETQPHLSGAYIRSLVKQLTSSNSRTKEKTFTMKDQNMPKDDQNMSKNDTHVQTKAQAPQQQQHKKQVRRRLHTSRPYQERLLNMAEARREIVAALKFHRASMKQQQQEAAEKQQQQQQQSSYKEVLHQPPLSDQPSLGQDEKVEKSRKNSRTYPSSPGENYLQENLSYSYPNLSSSISPNFSWSNFPTDFTSGPDQNLEFSLPNQPLGLNLNFQDFSSLNSASLYHHQESNNNQSVLSFSSSSSSPPLSVAATTPERVGVGVGGCMHPVMDDEVMAEIRSIGEQHQMVWDDTKNLVTSAWWFKFLKTMELDNSTTTTTTQDDDGTTFHPFEFDQVMEFPSWINANESCLLQPLNGYYSSEEHFQDSAALPCMDIGEIEGMDAEWLS